MLENVTSQFSNLISWAGQFSLFIQLIVTFLIAYFMIRYTQFLQQRREFRAGIVWFLYEIAYLQSCLEVQLRLPVESLITEIESHPEKRNFAILPFPDLSLKSVDFILSHNFIELIGKENLQKFVDIQHNIQVLHYFMISYNAILVIPSSEATVKTVNDSQLAVLRAIQKETEKMHERVNNYKPPEYPYTSFLKYFFF